MARTGALPGYQVGRQWLFFLSELAAWLRAQAQFRQPIGPA